MQICKENQKKLITEIPLASRIFSSSSKSTAPAGPSMGLAEELQTASIYFCLMVGAKILKLSKAGLASPLNMQLIYTICSANFFIFNL
jgi:hypothetical protein